jgi:hypothetical protein
MMSETKAEEVAGYVEEQKALAGTASEHVGVVLTTDAGERLRLQRIGGNPFSDPPTRRLVGHRVSLTGYRLGPVFRYVGDAVRELA